MRITFKYCCLLNTFLTLKMSTIYDLTYAFFVHVTMVTMCNLYSYIACISCFKLNQFFIH